VLLSDAPHASVSLKKNALSTFADELEGATTATSPKAPSDAAFGMCTAAICLDTSRFRHRLIPLSRTLLPVPSQWFD
jgi:hypothetical protein